jgi:hypothetical protein
VVGAVHEVVLVGVVLAELNGSAVGLAIVANSGRWSSTVLASEDRTEGVLIVVSNVLLARGVSNTILIDPLIHLTRVATVARAASISVDDLLSVQSNGCWVLQVKENVEAVSKGGSGALSPAGAAVLWNVLILAP